MEECWPELWRVCGGGAGLGGLSLFWLADPLGNPGSFQALSLVVVVGGGPVGRDIARVLWVGRVGFSCLVLIPPAVGGRGHEGGEEPRQCVRSLFVSARSLCMRVSVCFYISVLRLIGATKGVQVSCGAITWCWACPRQSLCLSVCVCL